MTNAVIIAQFPAQIVVSLALRMKALLHGNNSKDIASLLKSLGVEIVNSKPDVVITYGGDGTLISSERMYPGIPKLPIRDSRVCNKCLRHQDETILKKLVAGKLTLSEYKKLETTILYKQLFALNDFVIRNVLPIHAIRFLTSVTSEKLLIGDGIVLSTPFGSSGYFKSITGKTFEKDWGLAFNNTTQNSPPIFLKDKDSVTFKLIRGTATLSFDNNPDLFKIDEGSEIMFKLSDQKAKIFEAQSLRCLDCKITRG